MPPKQPLIFLSYRRNDAKTALEDLYKILLRTYGADAVFRDTSMKGGAEFPATLREKIRQAETVLVVIGPSWMRAGTEGELDWVVEEVRLALKDKKKKIIPVLVEGATFPAKNSLHPAIRALAEKQAVVLDPANIHADAKRLADELGRKAEPEPIVEQNVSRLQLVETRRPHQKRVTCMAWAADGNSLISASEDGSVVWQKGRASVRRSGHQSPVRAVAFIPGEKLVVSLSADLRQIWSYSSGDLRSHNELPFKDQYVSGFAIFPDQDLLVAAPVGGSPEIWEIPEPLGPPEYIGIFLNMSLGEDMLEGVRVLSPPFRTTATTFSIDGSRFAAGSSRGKATLFDAPSAKLLWTSKAYPGAITVVAFSPDRQLLASASEKGLIRIHQVSSGAEWGLESSGSEITGAVFTAGRELLLCSRENGAALFVDVSSRTLLPAPAAAPGPATSIAMNASGTKLAIGTRAGQVETWSVE